MKQLFRVPTRTGKPGKMGSHFPVREKSGNFDQTGKNTGKLREFQTNIICCSSVTAKLICRSILLAKFDKVFS